MAEYVEIPLAFGNSVDGLRVLLTRFDDGSISARLSQDDFKTYYRPTFILRRLSGLDSHGLI